MGPQKSMPFIFIVLSLALVLSRIVPLYLSFPASEPSFTTPFYQNLFGSGGQYQRLSLLISAIFTLFIGLSIHLVINGLWIFETRNLMPVLIGMLLLSSGYSMQQMSDAYLLPILVLFTLFLLFSSEKTDLNNRRVFNISLLISSGSIISFYALYMLPLFLGLFLFLRKIDLKLFLSMLAGTLIPYWILWAILFLTNTAESFPLYFGAPEIELVRPLQFAQGYWLYIPGLTILALLSFFSFLGEYPKMKQSHRVIFLSSNVLAIYALLIFVLGLIPLQHAISMALPTFVLIFTLYFQLSSKKMVWIFFAGYLIFFCTSFITRF